jgi:RNA polymerase sigma-70 factor (ECF subfamily)
MNRQKASDTNLISQVLAGNTRSYAILVGRYQHMVFTLSVRMLRDRELAEETTQDVFVKAYSSLQGFRGDSKFSTWLYRIAYHRILDECDRQKRKLDQRAEYTQDRIAAKAGNPTWDNLLESERKEVLLKALSLLSAEENSLISLFYLQELSLKELGEVLGLNPDTVKVRLFRARTRLKTIMDKSNTGTLLKSYER